MPFIQFYVLLSLNSGPPYRFNNESMGLFMSPMPVDGNLMCSMKNQT